MKTVKLFSLILINFSKTQKLITNGENNFTIAADFSGFQKRWQTNLTD
jgi:hypothetical protein